MERLVMAGCRTLSALILLPVLGSAIATWWPAEPALSAAAEPPRTLAFDQYLVNLRDVPLQPVLWGDFRFTNVGTRPLTITELKPSCGCLQPQLAGDKRTYQPGERGLFQVEIATANEPPGPQEYSVAVKYTDSEPHEAKVRFKVRLPERKITVDPPELAFFQYNGEPSSRVIHVTDYRGSSLEIVRASSTSELITLAVQPADVDEGGHHRVRVELSVPGRVPPGRQMATVTIETNDPEFSRLRIPVLIDGPSVPVGDIQPVGHEQPAR